jgi:tRNA nucleotidyltransferase (CCA-adding enzyme)
VAPSVELDPAARERLRASVPEPVREVCRVLQGAGHEAVTVGGAVRDALLGRAPGDWDVATSAHPDQVIASFKRTIPTGLQHGTVTVMVGRGDERQGVEVTTYRGEGAYSDARRPDTVTFGVPLDEDLARRDFVINAIAYDPIADRVHDPFGGADDIAARRVRAVGDAVARFTEDGLRVMRAVRFAAVLEFTLDGATETAIPAALGSLAKVSQERVHDELVKLMAARQPSRGLVIAARTGVIRTIAPELDPRPLDDALALVDALPRDPVLRVAGLWTALGDPRAMCAGDERTAAAGDPALAKAIDAAMRRLKFSNEDRDRIVRAARVWSAPARAWSDAGVRRVLAGVGRSRAPDAISLWRGTASRPEGTAQLAARAESSLAAQEPLVAGDLAISGGDVMSVLGLGPGKKVGEILAALLERVLEDPSLNTRERLAELARALA